MWIYVIINAEISNLFTECCILQDFALKGSPTESDYILILFIQAVEHFKREGNFGIHSKTSNITPILIQTKTIIPETSTDYYASRSQSMVSTTSKMGSNNNNDEKSIIGSVTSSIKGLFK